MNEEKVCRFCEQFKRSKAKETHFKEMFPRPNQEDYKTEFTVTLEIDRYHKGIITGGIALHGYELNFCPTCGKPLKEE